MNFDLGGPGSAAGPVASPPPRHSRLPSALFFLRALFSRPTSLGALLRRVDGPLFPPRHPPPRRKPRQPRATPAAKLSTISICPSSRLHAFFSAYYPAQPGPLNHCVNCSIVRKVPKLSIDQVRVDSLNKESTISICVVFCSISPREGEIPVQLVFEISTN